MSSRHLIFVPEINSTSFVFFYEMGEASYSVREYHQPPSPRVRYAREFPFSASEIRRMARRPGNHFLDAERHDTGDFNFWQKQIAGVNRIFLEGKMGGITSQFEITRMDSTDLLKARYPLLNEVGLRKSAKSLKRKDMERIFQSRNSED